jgi:putative PIN family toxin of toxin-antitoxin system
VRVVLDPNILISAMLSPSGAPARLLARWLAGDFELIASRQLLAELERALTYPKLRERIQPEKAARFMEFLHLRAEDVEDVPDPPRRSPDPDDDYLIALSASARAVLVSGDAHLLGLAGSIPAYSAQGCLEWLDSTLG